jgi:hypothetical protein
LPEVLYLYEILSVILREGKRLKVFKNRILRRIFGPKMDKITGGLKKLQNAELQQLSTSSNITRMI